jgi:hypothetical protein
LLVTFRSRLAHGGAVGFAPPLVELLVGLQDDRTTTEGGPMRLGSLIIALAGVVVASSASASVKSYNASAENGTPGDFITVAINLCPPVQTTLGVLSGFVELNDDGAGTVTLNDVEIVYTNFVNYGPELLTEVFGPGGFIFIDAGTTTKISSAQTSNTSGIGTFGSSGTAPGQATEWGVLTGWFQAAGFQYCESSPTAICDQNGFAHGATIFPVLPSDTYDLGTWSFDAAGDYQAADAYIQRTGNGGLTNSSYLLRGAFQGASLPALPLVGFGALTLGLVVIGSRSLLGRR